MTVVKAKHLSDIIDLGKTKLIAYVLFSSKLDTQIIVSNNVYEELEKECMEMNRLAKSQERQHFIKANRLTDIIGPINELDVLAYVIYSTTLRQNILVSIDLFLALNQQNNIVHDLFFNEEDGEYEL